MSLRARPPLARRPLRARETALLAAALCALSMVATGTPVARADEALELHNECVRHLTAKRPAEAIAACKRALELTPTGVNVRLRLAEAYAMNNQTATAWRMYKEAEEVATSQ